MKKLKVLFVQELYCDKNPNWLTNSIHNVFNSFIQSCPQYVFHRVHYDECQMVYGKHIDEILPDYCKNNEIDVIIVTPLGGGGIMGDNSNPSETCLLKLKELGVYICYQWPDFGGGFGGETAKYLDQQGLANLHIIWDNGWSPYHNSYPYSDRHLKLWVPQDNKMFTPKFGEQTVPVSFIGSPRYQDRSFFISHLRSMLPEFVLRGGQREENLGPYEYADFIRDSKISINFSLSPANFFQTKGRVFEVMACQSMLLEYKNPATASLFEPGVDYVEFEQPNDLVDKAYYYLEHDEERKKIAESGYNKYLQKYTGKIYWDTIFDKIKKDLNP